MKVKLIFLLLGAGCAFLFSCRKNDSCENRNGAYDHGVFVVNEGPFGGTGTITWHDPATGQTVQEVYEAENCGASLGQFVQSLTFFNGKGYIVVNGANRIVIVDAVTFKYLGTIEGLELPRFFLPLHNGFAYVSQWGFDGISGSLAKVDLLSKRVVKKIELGSGPEKMLLLGDRVLVANSGGYGVDYTISEVDIHTDGVVNRYVATGSNPSSLVSLDGTVANTVYLCKGFYQDTVVVGNINLLQGGTQGGETPAYSDDLTLGSDGAMYFTGNSKIYKAVKQGANIQLTELFDQNAYGFALDTAASLFYCADAGGFSGAGEMTVRNGSGAVVRSFSTGVAPGEIVIVK